jgi:signal transduction histidine kinase/GAF domain-containing protein
MEARTQTPTIEESSIVERVARIVSSGHEWRGTKPDYTHLAAELEPAIPFDVFGIVLLRHDRQAVRITVCIRGTDASWVEQYHQHPLEDSMTQRLLQRPEMLVQNYPAGLDGPPAHSGDALSGYPQLHAALVAPLIVGERLLGALELGSTALGTYDDEALQRLIRAVVHVLAAAIESAQTGGNVEIQDRQRHALKQVSSALASTMDLSTILHHIVVGIAEALHVSSAIVTLGRREQRLHLEAQSGLDPSILHRVIESSEARSERSIIGYTLLRRQPFVSNDIDVDERFPASRVFTTELAIRSIFSYPLVTGTTIYGALLLCSPEPGGFTPLKADILSLFAGQATIAIHTGMLLESAHQRSHFQEAIEQLEQAHQQKADEYELLERVRQESQRTFGVSFTSLLRFISDHLLTRNERDLQALMSAAREEYHTITSLRTTQPQTLVQKEENSSHCSSTEEAFTSQALFGEQKTLRSAPQETSVTWLTQTAETALARADLLRDVGAALATAQAQSWASTRTKEARGPLNAAENDMGTPHSLHEVTNDRDDAWLVVDLDGRCVYMNPAAEVFCGIRLMETWEDATVTNSTLEDVFALVLPRMRNIDEVRLYLYDFALNTRMEDLPPQGEAPVRLKRNFTNNVIRCVLTAETVEQGRPLRVAGVPAISEQSAAGQQNVRKSRSAVNSKRFNKPSTDRYYQLTRYPLYNRNGQLLAHALQVHEVTEQVRDEKNKSALLSSVSHDLRTPLTTIKAGVSGLLQPDVVWDEHIRQEILKDIEAEVDHLDLLVNALIDMSRIEMGALVLEKEWCDVVEILHAALTRSKRFLAGRPVRIITPLESQIHLPLIQADYVQLERVFYNLFENAAYRSSLMEEQAEVEALSIRSEITVALAIVDGDSEVEARETSSMTREESRRRMLRVQFIDRGPALPEGERERLFKSFYSHGSAPGGGLGLAVSRGIVEAHQGRIWMDLTSDGGVCFAFTLPVYSLVPSRTSLERLQ